MKLYNVLFTFALFFIMTACAPNTVVKPTPIAEFEKTALSAPQRDYLIGIGDILDIKFTYNP